MAFGVRRSNKPIPANKDFYVCPFCKEVFVKKKDYTDHLTKHVEEVQ